MTIPNSTMFAALFLSLVSSVVAQSCLTGCTAQLQSSICEANNQTCICDDFGYATNLASCLQSGCNTQNFQSALVVEFCVHSTSLTAYSLALKPLASMLYG